MANGNVDNKIIVGIDQAASKKLIEKDLKKLLSQIKDLELQISRIKLDKKAISELEAGFQSLGQASQKLSDGQKGLFDSVGFLLFQINIRNFPLLSNRQPKWQK